MAEIPDDIWKSGIAFTGEPKQRIAYMEGMIAERQRCAALARDADVAKPAWATIAPRQFDAGVCCAQETIANAIEEGRKP